jgi:type IV pilus assembly protein PilV
MNTDNGFTLIEILIAMVVLSFALLAVAGMQVTVIRTNSSSNLLTQGATIAQEKIEELMTLPYNHLNLIDTTPEGSFTTYNEPNPPDGYSVQWQVDEGSPIPNNKTVNVNVLWNSAGNTKSFSLSFVKSNI